MTCIGKIAKTFHMAKIPRMRYSHYRACMATVTTKYLVCIGVKVYCMTVYRSNTTIMDCLIVFCQHYIYVLYF